jgi:uncharacterized protein YjbI with pentapeptide repeats
VPGPGDGPELRIELRRSGGGAGSVSGDAEVTLTREVPCRQMRFEAGDYEAHLHHLGGPQTGAVHVFAQPRYAPMDADAPLGSLLQRMAGGAAVKSAAGSASVARKDTGACALIDTIALRDNATGTYFRTTLPGRFADYFEMYRVSAAGLIAAPQDTVPTADSMLSVHACGDAPDGVLKFANQHGVFLQSRCGYPMFSATSIDDATAYRPVWTPAFKRLDLINDENNALLTGVARSAGRVINGSSPQNADAQPGLGTCGAMPADLVDPQVWPIEWKGYDTTHFTLGYDHRAKKSTIATGAPIPAYGFYPGTSEGLAPSDGPMTMVAEFAYRPMGTVLSLAPVIGPIRISTSPGTTNKTVLLARDMTYYHSGDVNRTDFTYPPAVIDATGGFQPTRQEALVFSVGSCVNCDLTGLDLSGRTMASIDLSDARIDGATFKDAQFAFLKLDRAQVTGTDFTHATFVSVSAVGASFSGGVAGGQAVNTVFDGTRLGDPVNFRSQFAGARFIGPNVTLANLDLSHAHWSGVTLTGVTLERVVLDGIDLSGARITHVATVGGSMVGATFARAVVDTFTIDSALARGVDFSNATLTGLSLIGADLTGAKFTSAALTTTTFDGAFVVGTDFTKTTWSGGSFQNVQAYSSGTPDTTTSFAGCTIASGSFENALFMESVFDQCHLQGGSFGGSNFVAASFNGVTNVADGTGSALSFAGAVMLGTKFPSATFDRVSLLDAVFSTGPGSIVVTAVTVPAGATSPAQSAGLSYHYRASVLPASTTTLTTCPNGHLGPCTGSAWLPRTPPISTGTPDPNSF